MLKAPSVISVAIDGPAASGKSTVAKRLALELGLTYVNTGALYRTVALAAQRAGVGWEDDAGLAGIVAGLDVRLEHDGRESRVRLAGHDVSAAIRTPEITYGASVVAAREPVRRGLLDLQRSLAGLPPGVVIEGRDIGTVVLPDATAKVFLTASHEVRARRRFDERRARGEQVRYEDVLAAELERDRADETRAIAPLRQAPDAVLIDSSALTLDDVIARIAAVVRQKTGASSDDAPKPL